MFAASYHGHCDVVKCLRRFGAHITVSNCSLRVETLSGDHQDWGGNAVFLGNRGDH
jgi:hypothetical protein